MIVLKDSRKAQQYLGMNAKGQEVIRIRIAF